MPICTASFSLQIEGTSYQAIRECKAQAKALCAFLSKPAKQIQKNKDTNAICKIIFHKVGRFVLMNFL
jgi:hypothetical protein